MTIPTKKYELGKADSRGLRRVAYLRGGVWGPAGTVGGWLESESNLSHDGDCCVLGEARVYGEARVSRTPMILSLGVGHVVTVTDSLVAWIENYEEIGMRNEYTATVRDIFGDLLRFIQKARPSCLE